VADVVRQLFATEEALDKLGGRGISIGEAEQLLRNRHVLVRNLRGHPDRRQREARRLLIGLTDGERVITLVGSSDDRAHHLAAHHRLGGNGSRA